MDNKDKYKLLVLLHHPSHERRSGAFNQDHDLNNQPPPLQDMESSFCSVSNLKSCVIYLAQELQNLGFRYKIVEPNEEKLNLVALVNACWDIIQLYHSAVKDGNILHDSRRRDVADINHLQCTVRDLKSTIEEKERQLLEAQEKERQANSINKALASKLKTEKDDVKRLNSILQQRELQHQHENRKKEIEVNKLQDRLQRFVTGDRGTETRIPTITMTSSLSRSDRARGRWRTDNTSVKQEEELYRRVLGQYETWVAQLTEEADLLKEFLSTASGRISKIALKCANSQLSSVANEEEALSDSLACSVLSAECQEEDPIFSLSFITSKDKIQKIFEDNLQIISQTLDGKDKSKSNSLDQDLYSSIEKNIEDVVEGMCVEKESEMEDQIKQVLDLKKKLQREREKYASAAVKLNRERANFEAEKVELLKHQFLSELPKSISSNSGTPFTPNTSFECPVNGSLSDLYGDSPHAIPAVPVLTSPTGNITRTTQPITLGPTRMTRSHREGKIKTSKYGMLSDPSTRTPSANRTSDVRFLHEVSRSKTLERPTSSAGHTPFANDSEEGTSYSTRSLSRPGKRKQLLTSANINLSHSINCPPLEVRERYGTNISELASSNAPSGDRVVSRVSLAQTVDESVSTDSGFYHDDTDSQSSVYRKIRNVQTNSRLNALENSLMNLLDQINSKERLSLTCPAGGLPFSSRTNVEGEAEVSKDESSGRPSFQRRNSLNILHNKPARDFPFDSQQNPMASPSSSTGISDTSSSVSAFNRYTDDSNNASNRISVHSTQLPDIERKLAFRQASMPGSVSTSRKSSCDRKTGEYYLKKIQNNFAKWYWK